MTGSWIARVQGSVPAVPELSLPEPPPKSGRGSGRAAWVAYAESIGRVVPEGANRQDIIDLVEAPPLPAGPFGVRGQRLWDALVDRVEGEAGLVLLEEAARVANRLDKLDDLLQGKADGWCRLEAISPRVIELRVDGPLIEARQQANVLRQLIAALPLKEAAGDGDDDGWLDALSP